MTPPLRFCWKDWIALGALTACAAFAAGCGQKACLRWTELEGACPSQADAPEFFGTCNDLESVDSDGTFDDGLCCYSVTKVADDGITCLEDGSFGSGGGVGTGGLNFSNGHGGGSQCDGVGRCGDISSHCLGCGVAAVCAELIDSCTSDAACNELFNCASGCIGGEPCTDLCPTSDPAAVAVYRAIVDCLVCTACPFDCAHIQDTCSSGQGGAGGMTGVGGAGGSG